MKIVEIDKKGKIKIPKKIINKLNLKSKERFIIEIIGKDKLLISKIVKKRKGKDTLIELLENPIEISSKIRKKDLDKIEDELWMGK